MEAIFAFEMYSDGSGYLCARTEDIKHQHKDPIFYDIRVGDTCRFGDYNLRRYIEYLGRCFWRKRHARYFRGVMLEIYSYFKAPDRVHELFDIEVRPFTEHILAFDGSRFERQHLEDKRDFNHRKEITYLLVALQHKACRRQNELALLYPTS